MKARGIYEKGKRVNYMNRRKGLSVGDSKSGKESVQVRRSCYSSLYTAVLILKNVSNRQSSGQTVCSPVSFANSCLEDSVAWPRPEVTLPNPNIPAVWGVRRAAQFLWGGCSSSVLKGLGLYWFSQW